jgi:hypothetical protein
VIFLGFAVVGCRIFGGRFHSCNDLSMGFQHECTGVYAVPQRVAPGSPVLGGEAVWMERTWQLPRYSFDWIGAGMLTLFEVASLDRWLDVLHSAMDATEVGEQPRKNHSWSACLYFTAFITVVGVPATGSLNVACNPRDCMPVVCFARVLQPGLCPGAHVISPFESDCQVYHTCHLVNQANSHPDGVAFERE